MTDRGRNPDRLGDAIRELARTMAENGRDRMELRVVTPTHRAVYEIRLLHTATRKSYAPRRIGIPVIEVEAFDPEPLSSPAAGSRQMVEQKKG